MPDLAVVIGVRLQLFDHLLHLCLLLKQLRADGMHRVWGIEARPKVPARMHKRSVCISVGESWAMGLPDPDLKPEDFDLEPRVLKRRSLVAYAEAKGTGARMVQELNSKGWLSLRRWPWLCACADCAAVGDTRAC